MIETARLENANDLLRFISTVGRQFFRHGDRVAWLELDARGRVWFHDAYNEARIYTHYRGRWRRFTNGGTLREVVEALRNFIKQGEMLPGLAFGPWPDWVCGGDLWGYGDDMEKVRDKSRSLGITPVPNTPDGTGDSCG